MIEKRKVFSSKDYRGELKKVYDSIDLFQLETIKEIFISESQKNTLRGMHFQTKPYELNKIVVCLEGHVLDVIVNINKQSKEFGKCSFIELNENDSIFVSSEYAHGFYCYENSKLLYVTDNVHSKEYESGVLWNSIDFDWPIKNPIISERDSHLGKINEL